MVKTYDAATEAALSAANVSFRYLAQLDLDDGTYRFGNHTPGDLESALGETWYGIGGLVEVPEFTTASGLAADEISLHMNGAFVLQPPPEYSSVGSWFRDILRRNLLNRRLTMYELILQEDTGAPLFPDKIFAGPIDRAPLDLDEPELVIRVRSNRQALTWSNGRSRSDADQRRTASDDGSLRHVADVASRGGKLPWGFIPNGGGTRSGGSDAEAAVRQALNKIL